MSVKFHTLLQKWFYFKGTHFYLFLLLFGISSISLNAQNGATLTISTAVAPSNNTYYARDHVTLTNGALITAESRVYIDPSLQLPVVYPTDPGTGFTSNFPDLDLNRSVGTLPGQPGVTAMGTGSYFIPFDFPTGTSGVVPQNFGLSYAAGSGQGIAGMGWNLSGLSSITRGGKNLINDNENFPVTFTNNDRFFFNGNLLIAEDFDINGLNYVTYKTKAESFSKIESFTSNPSNGPEWWKITTVNGTVIEIGNTANSKINYSGTVLGQSVFANLVWMVNKITDANGNYIEFFYDTKQNTEILLTKIKYAGNQVTNTQPDSEINFYYSLSEFPNHVFFNVKELNKTVLIRQVEVKTENGLFVRKYDFTYNKREVWEFLTSVEVTNSSGEKINPSYFKYDEFIGGDLSGNLLYKDGPNATPTATFPDLGINYRQFKHFIDYNGDGLKDMVVANYPFHPQTITSQIVWICKNIGNNTFEQENVLYNTWPVNDNCPYFQNSLSSLGSGHGKNLMFGEFNGDEFEDFVIQSIYTCQDDIDLQNYTSVYCQLYLSNGNGTFSIQTIAEENTPHLPINELFKYPSDQGNHKLIIADTDGDTKMEILMLFFDGSTGQNPFLKVYKYDHSNGFQCGNNCSQYFAGTFVTQYAYPTPFQTTSQFKIEGLFKLNANASGLDPHVLIPNPIALILQPSQLGIEVPCSEVFGNNLVNLIGDFNGDGSVDNLFNLSGGGGWQLKEFVAGIGTSRPINLGADPFPCDKIGIVYDVNQDGKSDYLHPSASGDSDVSFQVYLSTGNSFVAGESFIITNARSFQSTSFNFGILNSINFFDINGDGRVELLFGTKTYSFSKTTNYSYLKEIKSGFGHITEFEHQPWHSEGHYSCTFNATSENIGFVQPLRMLSEMKIGNGVGTYSSIQYSFANGIINRIGNGFIGFMGAKTLNPITNLETESTNILNTLYGILIPQISRNKIIAIGQDPEILISSTVLTSEVFQFNASSGNASIYRPYYLKNLIREQNDHINGIDVLENFTYNDASGTITNSTKTINGTFYSETTSSTLLNGLNFNGINFLPENITKSVTLDGGSISSSITYNYESTTKKLISQTHSVGNATFDVVENYSYNNFGNLNASESVCDGTTLSESLTFDTKNKRVVSKTNALGQVTQTDYHPVLGLPISQNLPTQLTTAMEYDGWGSIKKTTSTNGNITESATTWANASEIAGAHPTLVNTTAENIVFKQIITADGSPTLIKYFDNLGREIISKVESYNDWMWSAVSYDDHGRVITSFEPYELISNFPVIRNETEYDGLGRVSNSQRIVGSTTYLTSYTYSGGNGSSITSITYPDNTTTITKTDALGRIDEITDDNGTKIKKYYYTDPGNKTRIQTAVNSVQATEEFFDEAGNRTKLVDKQAGTTLYEYNGCGRLIKQTNPTPGAIYDYTYLADGRVEIKSGPEGTYNYVYATTVNGLNQLKEINGPNGNQILFTYDAQQRLIKKEEIYEGISYVNQYTYDALGRELTHHYPGSLETKNNFDSKGFLVKIEHANSGQMLWQLDEINSAGLLNKFTLGDANATTLSYTPERLLNVKSTPGVQVYDFDFNAQNGNLMKRQLSIGSNNKEEVFSYDNLERLEQQRFDEIPPLPVTPPTLNISYDPQGKILSKTDAGLDYRYNMNAQLKKIQQHQTAISLNEQNITYTPFRTVNSIEENGIELTYSYGPDQSRYKGIWKNNGTQYRKRIYASGYEINEETVNGVTTTQNISYVSSPSGLCAMYVEENGSGTFYYVHIDHLGSITAVTNANGNIIARQNFDAWGRRRKVQDYSYLPQNTSSTDNGLNNNGTLPQWLYRGYTGHEHLDEFALINMNARLYDPVVGMFLSPDNYIQAPGNTQNYNRYAYCLNNPLKYSDPSGNRFTSDDVGYMALGGAFGAASWQPILKYSFGNLSTGQAIGLYAVNATAFVASAGVGSAVSSVYGTIGFAGGAITGASSGFTSGFILGTGTTLVNSGNLNNSLINGIKGGVIGGVTGGVIGGISSGIYSINHGGDFWSGEGATFDAIGNSADPFTVEKNLEYNNDFAKKFSEANFGEVQGLTELHADGTLPNFGYYKVGDIVYNSKGIPVHGTTKYLGTGKGSIVYLYKSAFASKKLLYLTMGHEYLHVGYNLNKKLFHDSNRQHAAITKWQLDQATMWKYDVNLYQSYHDSFNGYTPYNLNSNPNYLPTITSSPWPY